MKQTLRAGRVVGMFVVAAMLSGFGIATTPASAQIKTNCTGVGRSPNGYPIRVTVTAKGKAVSGANISIKSEDGVPVDSGVTNAMGKFLDKLDPGTYSVTATSGDMTATGMLHVVKSAHTRLLLLKLATPPATPPTP